MLYFRIVDMLLSLLILF